jgi:hypothetical protein
MTRKNKCVECRDCEMRIDPKKGTRHYCASKKLVLALEGATRPACDKFALPEASAHWGP